MSELFDLKWLWLSTFLFSTLTFAIPKVAGCRCLPFQSCWPTLQDWSALNSSIQGNLVAVRPVAAVCYPAEFNEERCKYVNASWTDPVWRAAEPGAVQWENWEAWPARNERCYIETTNTTCGQGSVSLYSAKVVSASQIQEAVRFARTHDIRLVIKNSGHDFLGRSSAPESLQIFTHGMKGIQLHNNFMPKGAPRNSGGKGYAVTIEAGVSVAELYGAVSEQNRTVIAGAAGTIGAAGGYIQGGGHSPFGAWKGLGSDNALEFQVVLASGRLVYANAYQNSDLFWALRGGGGGTFGVVVSATLRTHPEVPVVVSNINITTSLDPSSHFWDGFAELHRALPALNDAGGSGYYAAWPNYPLNATAGVSTMSVILFFANYSDTAKVDQLYLPLISKLKRIEGIMTQYKAFSSPSVNATLSSIISPQNDTGVFALIASRLYSKDLLTSQNGPEKFAKAWSSLTHPPGIPILGNVVAGGAVAANGDTIDSAVNPAWRKTTVHTAFQRTWSPTATLAEQQAVLNNVTNVELPIIRSPEGADKMGAYVNEGYAYETDFQASFWGKNYDRLYKIKQQVDPTGLFITRRGVGSEDWDDSGLCRIAAK
ncbi:hypothetical protein N7474_000554 [Penicillium riverlandense]|uniref:uncharacterized protein n=1 Tax=Penicillium riverlandense TaxID=1903569 RepID=UPI002546E229|nr:uncharacterized protein N7474_000554 [Penicillium riverlandense]KAJ5832243.1 hypothetical protein N7474_000554 [Penicillium riverlandense]